MRSNLRGRTPECGPHALWRLLQLQLHLCTCIAVLYSNLNSTRPATAERAVHVLTLEEREPAADNLIKSHSMRSRRHLGSSRAVLALVTLLLIGGSHAACVGSTQQLRDGASFYVVSVAPGDGLKSAFEAALPCSPGSNVALQLAAGVYTLSAEINPGSGQQLRIMGLGPAQTTINGQASTRHFVVNGRLEVFDLTLYNGNPTAWCGGSIKFWNPNFDAVLRNVRFVDNTANGGGGAIDAHMDNGRLATLINVYFENNYCRNCGSYGGGAANARGPAGGGGIACASCYCTNNLPNIFGGFSTPCPPPPPPVNSSWWRVATGSQYCHLIDEGKCVTDGANDYGHSEDCEVEALQTFQVSTRQFRLRADVSDGVTLAGGWYGRSTSGPNGVTVTTGQYLTWFSEAQGDTAVASARGFEICAVMPSPAPPPAPPKPPTPPPQPPTPLLPPPLAPPLPPSPPPPHTPPASPLPSPPPLPGPPPPSFPPIQLSRAFVCELTIGTDITSVGTAGSTERRDWELAFSHGLSEVIGISAARIGVVSVRGGSVTVVTLIQERAELSCAGDLCPKQAKASLDALIAKLGDETAEPIAIGSLGRLTSIAVLDLPSEASDNSAGGDGMLGGGGSTMMLALVIAASLLGCGCLACAVVLAYLLMRKRSRDPATIGVTPSDRYRAAAVEAEAAAATTRRACGAAGRASTTEGGIAGARRTAAAATRRQQQSECAAKSAANKAGASSGKEKSAGKGNTEGKKEPRGGGVRTGWFGRRGGAPAAGGRPVFSPTGRPRELDEMEEDGDGDDEEWAAAVAEVMAAEEAAAKAREEADAKAAATAAANEAGGSASDFMQRAKDSVPDEVPCLLCGASMPEDQIDLHSFMCKNKDACRARRKVARSPSKNSAKGPAASLPPL